MRTVRILALLALAGCVRNDPQPPADPTWLRWASPNPVPLGELSDCRSAQCLPFSGLVREGLTRVSWEGTELVARPALAESWQQQDNVWTFLLKKDLKWNDGTALKASHLIEEWKSVVSNCRKYPGASLLFGVENAEAFCMGKAKATDIGWKAVDDRTLELKLTRADAEFPRVFAHPVTWPGRPAPHDKSVLSIGPFQPAGRTPRGDVRFVRNPHYHGTPARMDGVLVQWIPEPEVRMEMYLQGETDLVTELPDSLWSSVAHQKGLTSLPTDELYVAIFDPSVEPFQEKVVRQAFQKSIETQEVLDLMRPFLAPAAGLFPSSPSAPVPQWAVLFSPKSMGDTVRKWIEPMPKVKGAPSLTFRVADSDPLLGKVVENLQVQWQRRLGTQVVPQTAGKKPGIRILSTRVNPLGGTPALDRFVARYLGMKLGDKPQKDWIRDEAYALPIAFRAQPHLLSSRIAGMECTGVVPCSLAEATAAQ